MAEQEVIKHTKKIYRIWGNKEHSVWHKLKEFLIEIFIIVFAITLSIWFHNWSEHNHVQKETKEFLISLKTDLEGDIKEMEDDISSYKQQQKTFEYITRLKMNEVLNKDSLSSYGNFLYNTTSLNTNNGRFEGFKSSGKIGNIEDKELQNDIMDLYTENIPAVILSTTSYIRRKELLWQYILKNKVRLTDSTTNLNVILSGDEAQNICNTLTYTGEVTGRYQICIDKAKRIIELINKEYRLK